MHPPLHQNHMYIQTSPPTSLEQSLSAPLGTVSWAAVLFLPQVKFNSHVVLFFPLQVSTILIGNEFSQQHLMLDDFHVPTPILYPLKIIHRSLLLPSWLDRPNLPHALHSTAPTLKSRNVNMCTEITHEYGSSDGKRIILQCRRCRFDPWVRKIPWRRKMATSSSILVAWRSPPTEEPGGLQSYSLWDPKESDTTERFTLTMYKELMKITRWGLVRKAHLFLDLVPEASSLLNPRMQGFTCVVMRQKWSKGQSCQQKPWDSSPSSVTEKADPAEEPTKPNQTKFSS